ncbi:MAG: isoprenylcysteine carboxylmethyltransferase family protein [Planctomycetes bacterium]|nr:isoprenylcysteine carboxylmethyltransferase family protein [Planctomycetota bacterium]
MAENNHSFIERFKGYIPTRRKKLRSLLILTGIILFALKVSEWNNAFTIPAIIIMLPGMALHLWTKGHLHQNKILTKTGPYRWIRNPFYLADLLIDLAICLMVNSVILGITYIALWLFVYLKTIRREETTLEGIFGDDFIDYKSKVPMLVPYKLPLKSEGEQSTVFSWKSPNIAEGKEISRLLSFAYLPFLFYCLSGIMSEGIDFTLDGFNTLALSMFILLAWLAYAIRIILKEKKPALPEWAGVNIIQYIFMVLFLDALFFVNHFPIGTKTFVLKIELLSSILLLIFILLSPKRLWLKFRFYNTIRCIIALLLSFLAEQPWLALFPLGYYIPRIIHGEKAEKQHTRWATPFLITIGFLLIGTGLMLLKMNLHSGIVISFW